VNLFFESSDSLEVIFGKAWGSNLYSWVNLVDGNAIASFFLMASTSFRSLPSATHSLKTDSGIMIVLKYSFSKESFPIFAR